MDRDFAYKPSNVLMVTCEITKSVGLLTCSDLDAL